MPEASIAELHPKIAAISRAAVSAHRQDLLAVQPLRRFGRRLTLAGLLVFAVVLAANLLVAIATDSKRVYSGEVAFLNVVAVLGMIGLVLYGNAQMRRAALRIKPAAIERFATPLRLRNESKAENETRAAFRRLGWLIDRTSDGDDVFAGEHAGLRFRLLDAIYAVGKNFVGRRLVLAIDRPEAVPGLAIATQRSATKAHSGLDGKTLLALGGLAESASGDGIFDEKFIIFAAAEAPVERIFSRAVCRGIAALDDKYGGRRFAIAVTGKQLFARLDLGSDTFDFHAAADEDVYIAEFLAGLSFPYWCIDLVAQPLTRSETP